MKKTAKILTLLLVAGSILSACKKKDNEPTAFASAGRNTITGSVDNGTLIRTLTTSGFSNNVHDVKITVQGSCTLLSDIELYLKSPSGKILELVSDPNDGTTSFSPTFSDAGTYAANVWNTGGGTTWDGIYKPEGSLSTGSNSYTGTITSFAGFKGDTPNGTWTLYVCDDAGADILYFTSFELFISTSK
jgi:subtilisin-like proprotein convertase family protein